MSLRFVLNTKTFYPKRTCVSLKTYLRLNSNALAFFTPFQNPTEATFCTFLNHYAYFFSQNACIFKNKSYLCTRD